MILGQRQSAGRGGEGQQSGTGYRVSWAGARLPVWPSDRRTGADPVNKLVLRGDRVRGDDSVQPTLINVVLIYFV